MEDFRKLNSATISKIRDNLLAMEEDYDEKQKSKDSSLNYVVPFSEISKTIFVDLRSNAKESKHKFPSSMLTTLGDAVADYSSLFNKSKKYIFIDNTGEVSSFVVKILGLFNYDVSYLDGGMNEFKQWLSENKKEKKDNN